MQHTIEIIVSPQGETRLETMGFAGSSCREASRFLEEALGQRLSERLTAEYYGRTTAEASQHERQ